MSELLKSKKHMLCALICLVVIVGAVMVLSWTPKNGEGGNCGCAMAGQYEGLYTPKTPALQSLYKENKPKHRLIHYNKPSERFVPLPAGNSMMNQMNSMRGTPVSKSMNSMAPSNPQSPFINYGQ